MGDILDATAAIVIKDRKVLITQNLQTINWLDDGNYPGKNWSLEKVGKNGKPGK